MKKWMTLLLTGLLMFGLAACGQTDEGGAAGSDPASIGEILLGEFLEKAEAGQTGEELANALVSSDVIEFEGAVMPVEPGFLNGFDSEITDFSEGWMFGPMIGSIPFVGYVFQLDEGADADAFVENLKAHGDLRWNVCTQADEMVCTNSGNTVFFVMCPISFEE